MAILESDLKTSFDLPPLPVEQEGRDYWLGTLPACPQFNLGIGGIMFHRYTDPPIGRDASSGEQKRAYRKGGVEKLTEGKVQGIIAGIKNRVVQWRMKKGKDGVWARAEGYVISQDSKSYFRQRGDEPLAKYVYIVPVTEAVFPSLMAMDDAYPASVYETELDRVTRADAPELDRK